MPIKWKLMITSIPYVIAVMVIKLFLHKLGQPGVLDFSDLGIVYTGGVFLMGFNLAGTMADYKESERIPGELACIIETMEDSLKQAARQKPDFDLGRSRKLHAATLDAIIDWLLKKKTQAALFGDIEATIEVAYALDRAGVPAIGGRYVSELHNLRKSVTRMGVISRTGVLESGFAFLQFLTVMIIVLLLLSKFKNPLSEAILVSFVSLIYIYMLGLIKDIDDPFEYNPDGRRRGCAEVELFPLLEYQQRLQARLAAVGSAENAAVVPAKVDSTTNSPASTVQASTVQASTVQASTGTGTGDPPGDNPDHAAITANTVHATGNASNPPSPSPEQSSSLGDSSDGTAHVPGGATGS